MKGPHTPAPAHAPPHAGATPVVVAARLYAPRSLPPSQRPCPRGAHLSIAATADSPSPTAALPTTPPSPAHAPSSLQPLATAPAQGAPSKQPPKDASGPVSPRSPAPRPPRSAPQQDTFQHLQLDLPPPANTKVVTSKFVKSSSQASDCPGGKVPEFAVIGRSNTGKSSLINCLTNNKLAKVSKEPGMTKLINHFLINDSWYLVDLPGYGFSKTTSKSSRQEWLDFTKDYFIKRDALAHVMLLVDSSLPPQPVDVECANWLAECEVPFAIVFTKLDNRKKEGPTPQQNIRAFKVLLSKEFEQLPWCFETSSRTGAGRLELLGYLSSVRQLHDASKGQ